MAFVRSATGDSGSAATDHSSHGSGDDSPYFAEYERRFDLPVHRPVRVTAVSRTGDDRFLDLLVEAKIRCLRTPSATLVWLYQAESREFESMLLVPTSARASLLNT